MKRKLHFKVLAVLPLLWASSVEAKITETPAPNFGVAEKMSFEIEDAGLLWGASGWWAQNALEGQKFYGMWMRTDAQAADGDYSMLCKVPQGSTDAMAVIETQTAIGDGNNTVQLEKDKNYKIKLKVFIDGTQNAGLDILQIAFSEMITGGAWIDNRINSVGDLEKDKWVSVSANFTATSSNIYKMVVKPMNPDCSEQGLLFYVDQIELMEITETVNTGFGDGDMMDFEIADAATNGGADGWWANYGEGHYYKRTEDKAYTGTASMKVEVAKGSPVTPTSFLQTDDKDEANAARVNEPGDYVLRRYIWLDGSCNKSLTEINTFLTTGGQWITANIKPESLKKDEWVRVDSNVNFPVAGTGKMTIKMNNDAAAEDDVRFYVDAFELLPGDQATGVGSESEVKVMAYAQGESIVVNFAPLGGVVEVYNLSGVQIATKTVSGATTTFDVADGIYIVKVGNEVFKVVK